MEQLTLFGAFDKQKKRQENLFKELKSILRSFQYLQGHLNGHLADHSPDSKDKRVHIMNSSRQSIDFANYYLTCLMYGVTRELEEHKKNAIGYYNEMGTFKPYSIPTERISSTEQYESISETKSRLERLIFPYREELESNKPTATSYKFLKSTVENVKTNLNLLMKIDEKA